MALGFELARTNTAIGGAALAHTRRLMASWQVLADLCFADLLFLAPVQGEDGHRFVVLGQVRPTTDQTLYTNDMVGTVVGEIERPLILLSLGATRGNQLKAAQLLGLNRNTLRKKIRELDIDIARNLK